MLRLSSFLKNSSNIKTIKSLKEYQDLKSSSRLLVGYFHNESSTASLLYHNRFKEMAAASGTTADSETVYFQCDVDDVPQAAYDCEVADIPAISVQPLGSNNMTGSNYDRADLNTYQCSSSNSGGNGLNGCGDDMLGYEKIFPAAKSYIDGLKGGGLKGKDGSVRKGLDYSVNVGGYEMRYG